MRLWWTLWRVCSVGEDFNFQEYFQVSADPELKASPIWTIFWDVVNAFEPKKKRCDHHDQHDDDTCDSRSDPTEVAGPGPVMTSTADALPVCVLVVLQEAAQVHHGRQQAARTWHRGEPANGRTAAWHGASKTDCLRNLALCCYWTDALGRLGCLGVRLQILKIESPFVAFSLDDHRRIVQLLPQSHVRARTPLVGAFAQPAWSRPGLVLLGRREA